MKTNSRKQIGQVQLHNKAIVRKPKIATAYLKHSENCSQVTAKILRRKVSEFANTGCFSEFSVFSKVSGFVNSLTPDSEKYAVFTIPARPSSIFWFGLPGWGTNLLIPRNGQGPGGSGAAEAIDSPCALAEARRCICLDFSRGNFVGTLGGDFAGLFPNPQY